jgi:putative aldouronate transport system permease protein
MLYLRRSRGESAFDVLNTVLLLLLCAATLYPFLYVISRSLMSDEERAERPFGLVPHRIDPSGYVFIFSKKSLLYTAYGVTIFRTVVGTVLAVLIEAMFAYVIAKRSYPPRVALTAMIAFTMWFGGGLIPSFLLIRSLGLVNSVWVYIIPRLMSAWNILIMRNFFAQVPESLEESARMDGANDAVILFRIVVPLSTAVLATMGLFHAVSHWNEWFSALIYVNDHKKWPVMLVLRQILNEARQTDILDDINPEYKPPTLSVQMATTVVVAFPIIVVYPFIQKHFTKGIMIGSIKG